MFGRPSKSDMFQGRPLRSFLGHMQGINILDYPFGVLSYVKNMEYKFSSSNVYLQTRRGSTLVTEIDDEPFGAANYIYDQTTEFLIWAGDSLIKSYTFSTGVTDTLSGSAITADENVTFVMYGQGTNATLFGCDPGDSSNSVFKVSGATPTYAAVTSPANLDHIAFSSVAGRIFGVAGHNVYWTQQQATTGIGNISDWQVGTNLQPISPDDGAGFKCSLDMGQAHFFWKDTGIWCLLNGEAATTDWEFPKCDADIGTLSPNTVRLVMYGGRRGAIYLGADKTLRFFNGRVSRNAGNVPTIDNGDAKVISRHFQNLLNDISTDNLNKVVGFYWKNYYLLVYPNANTSKVNDCIVVNCDKLMAGKPGEDIQQPFWFIATNFAFKDFVYRKSNQKLYGFHRDKYISSLFENDLYTDGVPTSVDSSGTISVPWEVVTGWYRYAPQEMELTDAYVTWATTGNWTVNFRVNSFTQGDNIPPLGAGDMFTLDPSFGNTLIWDVGLWDVGVWGGGDGVKNQNVSIGNYGHFFSFSLYNDNKGEWGALYGVEPLFRVITGDAVGLLS